VAGGIVLIFYSVKIQGTMYVMNTNKYGVALMEYIEEEKVKI
jgi:hypothetical protein